MQTFTATEAKNNLGTVLDAAQRQPIIIEKQGKPYVVVLSKEDYETLDDAYWALQAKDGEDSGYLSYQESINSLKRISKKHVKVKP